MTFRMSLAAAPLIAVAAFGGAALAQNTMVGGAEMFPDKTIVENASASADHTTLVSAVTAAGLAETLSGPGPFTVFAPTNAAFAKLPEAAVADLLKPENKEMLTKVLTCHVVAADAMSPAIGKMIMDEGGSHVVDTLGGCKLTATINPDNNALQLTDENGTVATVTIPDVDQSNGVVHVIDTVMMPAM
ncbi:fasciclin domain-containing protein [Paracoccus subflavus]|uniref:Fasciclin domain-containing protein n=1 Tax=Paracoccus subflavus TaxID=2528244 RepID=A0A4Q9GBX8_9RHOB|nr:fasciclin domain-containing protein [Paracoccus subflavus]TBN43892.1 fasciclin domain-containing protein [Paracoccus subflavus]